MPGMRRREFITLLGGAAVAWPLTARAQQAERVRRVGALMTLAADGAVAQARNAAFLQGLQQSGWTVGRNLRIEYRWAAGSADDTRKYAAELVALAPDVILAAGSGAATPLLQATRGVPFVFAHVPDRRRRPVKQSGAAGRQRHWVYQFSNTAWAGNGWSCSSRSHRA